MLNQLLTGRYRVISTLGEGGLGKTYVAEDLFQPSHPQCVVKLLKPGSKDASFLPIARRLFQKEAETLEKLGKHPQIPQLLAHFEQKKEFLIVQEFIEGHTLSTELPVGHCWSANKVVLMLKDVLQILEFVHGYGVIHRDIKPNNLIRRNEDGKLVLIDFGAVKQVSDPRITTKAPLTPKTIAIGTQGYMPTEQARGKPRLSSDIYALGMIAIQALTGIDPINLEEDRDGEVIWQRYANVSDELAYLLSKMVRYHFRDRYKSASEVLQVLEAINISSENQKSLSLTSQKTIQKQQVLKETKVSLEPDDFRNQALSNQIAVRSNVYKEIQQTTTQEQSATLPKVVETRISLPNEDEISTKPVIHKPNHEQLSKKPKFNPWDAFGKSKPTDNSSPSKTIKSKKTDSEIKYSDKSQVSKLNIRATIEASSTTSENIKSKFTAESAPRQSIEHTSSKSLKSKTTKSKKNNLLTVSPSSETLENTKSKSTVESERLQSEREIIQKDTKADLNSQTKETKISLPNNNSREKEWGKIKKDLKATKISLNQKELSQSSDNRKVDNNHIVIKETVISQGILNKAKVSINEQNNNRSINYSDLLEKLKIYINLNNLYKFKSAINNNRQLISNKVNLGLLSTSQIFDLNLFNKIKSSNFLSNKISQKLLIGLSASAITFSLYSIHSFLKEKQQYSEAQEDLEEIKKYYQTNDYLLCIQASTEFGREFSDLNIALDSFLPECYSGQLEQAEKLAKESKLKDAISLASQIPANTDIEAKTKQLMSSWSQQIYQIAENKYQEGKLQDAIAIAQAIPKDTSLASEVETTIQQWNQKWQQDESHLEIAQEKFAAKKWQEAIDAAEKISENTYWQKQSTEIVDKAKAEIASAKARYTHRYNPPVYRKPVYRPPQFIPGKTPLRNLRTNPNHPINDPNRDWVKEKLGRD